MRERGGSRKIWKEIEMKLKLAGDEERREETFETNICEEFGDEMEEL